MKRHSGTLGFLPKEALRNYLGKEGVLGAKIDDGQLIGYLLYAAYSDRFRIAQLCVVDNFSRQGIARRLVNKLKETTTTQKIIKLHCRRDFPAHAMWPRLGFVSLGEKPGRSKDKHPLTLWRLTLATDDQLGLFQEITSDEALDVIIDAQIFFDFDEPDSDKSKPSKALLSDFLIDSLKLWITDELLNEISREEDSEQREKSRNKAHEFPKIEHAPQSAEHFEKVLNRLLPSSSLSQQSDIRQLAKAAASDVKIFVTRDQAILKKSEKITEQVKLQVVSPTELIIQLHELSEKQSYAPDRITGFSLCWQRLDSENIVSFPYTSFLNQGERQGKFREKLDALLASPNHYECEILQSMDEVVAIRVLTTDSNKILTAPLVRVALSVDDRSLFGRFVIADTVSKAVGKNLDMVKFEASVLTPSLGSDLLEMGFTKCNDSFVRFCFSRCLTREEVLSDVSELCPEAIGNYQDMSNFKLEWFCSPLGLDMTDQHYFLIPIRPGYAMSLIDRQQAAGDLFGGNPSVLLRWDNVYYRSKTHHNILMPPARILWYVSGDEAGQIVAISYLDAVEIDIAKALFKKFKKFGILKWEDIFNMCQGDPSKEIMALRFSHTFPFRAPISLKAIRKVFYEHGTNLVLQSPSKIPTEIFRQLFRRGYPNPS